MSRKGRQAFERNMLTLVLTQQQAQSVINSLRSLAYEALKDGEITALVLENPDRLEPNVKLEVLPE